MKLRRFLKRHGIRMGLSLAIVLLFLVNAKGGLPEDYTSRLENFAYDLRLRWTMPDSDTVDDRIVIVDIDEKSLKEQGHWPWSRAKLARMVDMLFDHYQIDVLGFDMVFAEKDESSGLARLEELGRTTLQSNDGYRVALAKLRPELDYDATFANSLKGRRVVLGYLFHYVHESKASTVGMLPPSRLRAESLYAGTVSARGYTANLPELQKNAQAAGYYSASLVDEDGVYRRASLLETYQGKAYEALSLSVARLALRATEIGRRSDLKHGNVEVKWLELGERLIPIDNDLAALIPYRGTQGSFRYVSATEVLNGQAPMGSLKGKIVLVGTTSAGLWDMRPAPMKNSYPGVEMHANLIAGMLDGNIKEGPGDTRSAELAFLIVVGTLLTCLLPSMNAQSATALTGMVAAILIAFNLFAWQTENLALPIASVLLLTGLLYVFNMSYGYFFESRRKRELERLLGLVLPPEVAQELAENPQAINLQGESRQMTVLFTDVRGFTTISEELDPRQLTRLMEEFLTPMTKVILDNLGTIDKYMGDSIMAFWGAPRHDEQHPRHALQAAVEIVSGLDALRDQFQAKGWPRIQIGIGINTGRMTVGHIGPSNRKEYTAMGDAVNLCSRLESLTKEYGVPIIVSESTRLAVSDFVFRELDCVRVKGRDKPIAIYEPICEVGKETDAIMEELALYGEALALYRAQAWDPAGSGFAELQKLYPDRYLYQLYARRIANIRHQPPEPGWDGAFTFTIK